MTHAKFYILVCDGNESVHQALAIESKDFPEFCILHARNGLEAVRYWVKRKINLVVVEPLLDHHAGFEVIQYIRDRNATVPIALLTAHNSGFTQNKAQLFNVERIISKPFDPTSVCRFFSQVQMVYY